HPRDVDADDDVDEQDQRPPAPAAHSVLLGGRGRSPTAQPQVSQTDRLHDMVRIGAHVHQDDIMAHAEAVGAEVVQFFLGDPQGYKKPVLPDQPIEGVDIYIHAPYLVNVATTNNRIRIPSRKLLAQHLEAAASIGAKGLIVHGGHLGKDDDPQVGFDNWRKVFERMECPSPVLIENTAGGGNAMARRLDSIARLWDALDGFDVG